jgi:LysM repeat protein
MKMKTRLASLLVILATSGPLLSATELERLRALCAEQEMQIRQLEIKIARLTDTPPPSRTDTPAPAVAERPSGSSTYTVKSGDSIERIARRHGSTAAALAKFNGLKPSSIIHPGQKLNIPGATAATASETTPAPRPAESRSHVVVAGDTFYKISVKYGVTVDQLIASNPGVDHRALRLGQLINVEKPASGELARTADPRPASSLSQISTVPVSNTPAPVAKPRASDRPVKIDKEITYGQFALQHSTTTQRLDELNGLELDASTVLAQGSELYIPAQP